MVVFLRLRRNKLLAQGHIRSLLEGEDLLQLSLLHIQIILGALKDANWPAWLHLQPLLYFVIACMETVYQMSFYKYYEQYRVGWL